MPLRIRRSHRAPSHTTTTSNHDAEAARPLRLWIVNQYAAQFPGPGLTRHHFIADAMTGHGVSTTIISDKPSLRGDRDRRPRTEDAPGARFVWLRTRRYRGNGIGRVINMFDFVRGALRWGWDPAAQAEARPDVVVGSSPQLFAALAGWVLARRHRVPFILEIRDLWPESFVAILGMSRRHPLVLVLAIVEKFLYQRSDHIIGVLDGVGDYVRMRVGLKAAPVTWIPNGVPLAQLPDPVPLPTAGEEFTVVYAGSHGPPNGLQTLLEAARWLQEHHSPGTTIGFDLYGDGVQKAALQAYARRHGLKNVRFHAPVPRTEVFTLLAGADALVVVLPGLYLYRFGTSLNKMFDYMAAARPVVMAADKPDTMVDRARAGLTTSASRPEDLARALLALAELPDEERAAMGRRGREYVTAHHDMATLGKRFADVLRRAVADL